MATANKEKKQEGAADRFPTTFEGSVLTATIATNGNQRKRFDADAMKQLTESIRQHGIINPLIVRDDGDRHVLIAGERRLRAARELGLNEVPVRIVKVTEEQAKQIQAVENLQRADLTPIEEAKAYVALAWSGDQGETVSEANYEEIAAKVGKAKSHVHRTIRLLELDQKVQDLLESGEMQVAVAHQILRVPEKHRDAIVKYATTKLEWYKRLPTLDEVKNEIEKKVEKDLKAAVFPKDVANYAGTDTPACATCPFNTGNQGLFGESEDGGCTNPGCYNKRTAGFYDELRADGEKRWPSLKFVGSATFGYGDNHQIAGAAVVDPKEKRFKKLFEEKPEAFGFGILKPSAYSSQKKPRLAVVLVDPSVLPKKEQPEVEDRSRRVDPRDQAKQSFVGQWVEMEMLKSARKLKTKGLLDDVVSRIGRDEDNTFVAALAAFGVSVEEGDEVAKKGFAKLSDDDKLRIAWLCQRADWELERELAERGIETKPIRKAAEKEAAAKFEERNKLRCRDCGCSPDVACKVKKADAKYDWETESCRWIETDDEKGPLCSAHATPKAKKKAKK